MSKGLKELAKELIGKYTFFDVPELADLELSTSTVKEALYHRAGVYPCPKCGAYRTIEKCVICEKLERM